MSSIVRAAGKVKADKVVVLAGTVDTTTADATTAAADTIALDGDLWFFAFLSHGTGAGSAIGKFTHCDTSGGSYVAITAVADSAAVDADTPAIVDVVVDRSQVKRYVKFTRDVTGTTSVSGVAFVAGVKHI
jgi:hypothetical protein